jgi:predicted AAA+ superfamily ATPase
MIKREGYLSKIRPFIDRDVIKVLTGIRRSGKSVMLELIKEELKEQGIPEDRFLSVNFESMKEGYTASLKETYAHVQSFSTDNKEKVYLFFDEVQELPGWEKMLNACMVDFDADIYITGSNAKLLSSELATCLGGRYVEFRIFPFSFREVLDSMPDADINQAFQLYLTRGGMPFLYQVPIDESSAMQYLNDVHDSIILKDIATRNKIRDIELLKRITFYLMANVGNTFSSTNISKYLKNEQRSVSSETIYNYIDYCTEACFLHLVSREDLTGKKILQFQEKIFIADHGMREAIYGNNLRDINQTLENIVFIELLRRGYDVHVGKHNNREVDFVASLGKEKIYVQVAYLLATEETVEREFSVLKMIPDNYPKFVVSMDEIDRGRSGIRNVHVKDFLLMENW